MTQLLLLAGPSLGRGPLPSRCAAAAGARAAAVAAAGAAGAAATWLALLLCQLLFSCEALDAPKLNPNLVIMFGVNEDMHAALASSGALGKSFSPFSSAITVLHQKKNVGLVYTTEKYWKCTTGGWFLRVRLSDPGPVESLDPYPLASSVEYIDRATIGDSPLPSLLSLQPLNPLYFSGFMLRTEGEDLEGWAGTLACINEGQPLQLFKGWPMVITSFPPGSWQREVSVLRVEVKEPPWDPSADPLFAALKNREGVLIHLTLKGHLPAATAEGLERKRRGSSGGGDDPQVVTFMGLVKNDYRRSFLSKGEWIAELRRQLERASVCILHRSNEIQAADHIEAAEAGREVEDDEEERVLQLLLQQQHEQQDEAPSAELETPPWVLSRPQTGGRSSQRETDVVWLKCAGIPVIVNAPFENVLRSLSPSLPRVVRSTLKPYKRWRLPALMSATLFLFSSLMLWGKGESLALLGVPPHKVPMGPLDVKGHLSYAAGLAGSSEQWVSNVWGESPGGAFFAADGRYYETPNSGRSLSLAQRAGILGGSVLSSLGLAAAVVTGVGLLSTAVKAAWKKALAKSKDAAATVIHKLPWIKSSGHNLDSIAHRFLQRHLEEDAQRHVLLMVFQSDPHLITSSSSSSSSSDRRSGSGGGGQQLVLALEGRDAALQPSSMELVGWLHKRLAAQSVLPPIDVLKRPFSRQQQTVVGTMANLSVGDFVRALLTPECGAEVDRHPSLLAFFSLSVVEPAPSSLQNTSWKEKRKRDASLRLLSHSLTMRQAVDFLNAYRGGGAHFVLTVGPPPPSKVVALGGGPLPPPSVSGGGPPPNHSRQETGRGSGASAAEGQAETTLEGGGLSAEAEQEDRRVWSAVEKQCFLLKKKTPVSIASATVSLRLNLGLPAALRGPSCRWPGAFGGALVLLHVPPLVDVKELSAALLAAFKKQGLLPQPEVSVLPGSPSSSPVAYAAEEESPTTPTAPPPLPSPAGGAPPQATIDLPEGLTEAALGFYVVVSAAAEDARQKALRGGPLSPSKPEEKEEREEVTLKRITFATRVKDMLDSHGYDGVSFGFVYLPHKASSQAETETETEEGSKEGRGFVHPLSAGLSVLEGAVFNFASKTLLLRQPKCPEDTADHTPERLLQLQQREEEQ
ncbi:hypothetical protein Efla_004619 [Eimeria flavescens]